MADRMVARTASRRRDSFVASGCLLSGWRPPRTRHGRQVRYECGGYERKQDFVVTCDGIPLSSGNAPFFGRRGTLHYILQWTIVLDKVEVCRCNGSKGNAQITHDGNRL